jgi:glycerophosphoryl diester phosphodiesterase
MMKPLAFSLLCVVALAGCKKEDFDIQNLNGGHILSMGHGGMGIHDAYPLNSSASILSCLNRDASGAEMDVQMTRDSVLVTFHGRDLSDGTDLEGLVHAHTWAELEQGHYDQAPYQSLPIMRLDRLFENLDDRYDHQYTFDIKLHRSTEDEPAYNATFARALVQLIDRFGIANNVMLESQVPDMLTRLKTLAPTLRLFIYPIDFDTGLATAQALDLFGITISTDKISAEQVRTAHDHGFWIALWDVYSKSDNEDAIRKNPEVIQTDRLDHLIGLLE